MAIDRSVGGRTTTQLVSWYRSGSPYTKAFEDYLLKALIHSTVLGVSLKEGVSYDGVLGVIEHRIAGQVDLTRLTRLEANRLALLGILGERVRRPLGKPSWKASPHSWGLPH